jgi:5'-AMP-activated protein kinase catalytic alpha subunit
MPVLGNYLLTDKVLGRGSNASVYLGFVHNSPTKKVAVKIVEKKGLSEEKRKELNQEIDILHSLQAHPGVIQLHDVFEDDVRVFLVFEHKSCDLYTFIRKNRPLPEETVRVIFKQLVDVVEFCHNNMVCHRDLKIENVLINEHTLEISLCDFGFATRFETDKPLSKWCGSPHTVAPEIILRQPYNPVAVDMWALGSILYALLCGTFPFQAKNFKEIFQRTTVGMVHPFPNFVSQSARDLVTRVLKTRPDKRPSSAEVQLHPFLLADCE